VISEFAYRQQISFLMLVVVAMLLVGFKPHGAREIPISTVELKGWLIADKCLNGRKTVPFDKLKFFVVPGESFRLGNSNTLAGFTWGHKIYVAQGFITDELVFAHEMIHSAGVVGHPQEYFQNCGL
jgi:hypothetical protein